MRDDMFRAHRYLPALLAGLALTASSACASGGYYRYPYPANTRVADERAYRNGYDEGLHAGQDDARRGRAIDYNRHNEYRDADHGYYREIDRRQYEQVFRQGFVDGYNESYNRYARSVPIPPAYPQRYPSGTVVLPRASTYGSPASQVGYRDGYDQGRSDARGGDRYDPVRAKRYRSADHDYDKRYGSKDEYKREYRGGFEQGYEQGYRENRRR
jgi:hypothetical protein